MSTTLGISKVFILDKYFNELQKFWDTEKRLQGKIFFHQNIFFRFLRCAIFRLLTTDKIMKMVPRNLNTQSSNNSEILESMIKLRYTVFEKYNQYQIFSRRFLCRILRIFVFFSKPSFDCELFVKLHEYKYCMN